MTHPSSAASQVAPKVRTRTIPFCHALAAQNSGKEIGASFKTVPQRHCGCQLARKGAKAENRSSAPPQSLAASPNTQALKSGPSAATHFKSAKYAVAHRAGTPKPPVNVHGAGMAVAEVEEAGGGITVSAGAIGSAALVDPSGGQIPTSQTIGLTTSSLAETFDVG